MNCLSWIFIAIIYSTQSSHTVDPETQTENEIHKLLISDHGRSREIWCVNAEVEVDVDSDLEECRKLDSVYFRNFELLFRNDAQQNGYDSFEDVLQSVPMAFPVQILGEPITNISDLMPLNEYQ